MFRFLTRQHFIVNLLAAIALVALIIMAFLWSLGFITHHGEYEKVPAIVGKTLDQATKTLEDKGFKVEVQDSLWYDSLPRLAVIKQSPEGDMMVKSNRVVYLTVNRSQPPLVEIPSMVGFSFRNAELYLKQLGLKLGDTTRRPNIAKDAVLEVLYQGKTITPGTKIFLGSTISFVLGSGPGEIQFDVPDLIGLTLQEARARLDSLHLDIGAVVLDPGVTDSLHGYIWEQRPAVKGEPDETGYRPVIKIREGQAIDLFIRRLPLSPEEVQAINQPKTSAKDSESDNDKEKKNEY